MGRPRPVTAPQVTLRRVRSDDAELIREWRNDDDAVRFSVNGRRVSPDEHARWFAEQVQNSERLFWIAEEHGNPVGQVRVDVREREGTVSIVVAPGQRGRGIGTSILRALHSEMAHHPDVDTLVALTHQDNAASLRAFERAGFRDLQQPEGAFTRLGWP
jgi:UDP-2,4-diacetamido-2,4,6-trideoxy-beta-L-altropyranose hydrolase